MNRRIISKKLIFLIVLYCLLFLLVGCQKSVNENELKMITMVEKQITFSPKTHALDNNDNFSPDGKYLCYDTRATVYNENLANCKSIEKVNIETGEETVLWEPPFVTGENAAPGVAAPSYHPKKNKVIFIHGPFLEEVEDRGYYSIKNRSAIEVDGDGNGELIKVDLRDIKNKITTPGAHRGGTHRHEYTRSGNRIGFTYDDIIVQKYDRTIGYMEENNNTAKGYTHYFSLILKPAEKGKSKPGEIEKAWDDSWIDSLGTMRAFIGKVRNESKNYDYDIFVADIPLDLDITTSFSGNNNEHPRPADGINIRRLTHGLKADGIIRSSNDGKTIAFTAEDENGILQIHLIKSDGSQETPTKITNLAGNAYATRWLPSGNWIFCLSDGDVIATYVGQEKKYGKSIKLNEQKLDRDELVVSQNGNLLAYDAPVLTRNSETKLVKDAAGNDFRQIFIMRLDWDKMNSIKL